MRQGYLLKNCQFWRKLKFLLHVSENYLSKIVFIVKFSIIFLILYINAHVIQLDNKINMYVLSLLFLLLLTVEAQKCYISLYQPQVQESQIISKFTRKMSTFELNVLLTSESLLITLKDFQDWSVYIRYFTGQDIGRYIDKSFRLRDITQKLQCSRITPNENQFIKQKYSYGQIVSDNQQPCFRIQKGGLIVAYLARQLKSNMRIQQKLSQVELGLIKIRSMTKREIQKVKQQLFSQNINFQKKSQIEILGQNIDQDEKVKETVFNIYDDKRVPVDLAYPFPYSAIGIIQVLSLNSQSYGTGFLIAPNVVMTAAHNLYDKKNIAEIRQITFFLGAFGLKGKKFDVKKHYFPEKLKQQSKYNYGIDYCILILEQKAQENYGFLPIDWSGKFLGEIQIAGYPAYVYREGIKQTTNQIFKDKGVYEKDSKGMIRYKIQTSSGQSGSPIIKYQNGEYKVIGIHTVGYRTFNQGVLLTNQIKNDLTKWLREQKQQNIFNYDEPIPRADLIAKNGLQPKESPLPIEPKAIISKAESPIGPKAIISKAESPIGPKAIASKAESPIGPKAIASKAESPIEPKAPTILKVDPLNNILSNLSNKTQRYSNGDYYAGEFQENVRHGKGTYFNEGGKFEGVWQNGRRKQGIYTQKNGSRWELDYSYNTNGSVIQTWRNNATLVGRYQGFMKNDKKQGRGTFDWVNGTTYEGEWRNDRFEGRGTLYFASGDIYEGDWKNGKREGNGTFYWADQRKWFGEFKNDQPHGKGVYFLSDGVQYLEYWQNHQQQNMIRQN